jgi:hypothetical protein
MKECDGSCCHGNPGPVPDELVHLFKQQWDGTWSCVNFNWQTRLCMDYENRPQFCRDWFCHCHECGAVLCKAREGVIVG